MTRLHSELYAKVVETAEQIADDLVEAGFRIEDRIAVLKLALAIVEVQASTDEKVDP